MTEFGRDWFVCKKPIFIPLGVTSGIRLSFEWRGGARTFLVWLIPVFAVFYLYNSECSKLMRKSAVGVPAVFVSLFPGFARIAFLGRENKAALFATFMLILLSNFTVFFLFDRKI